MASDSISKVVAMEAWSQLVQSIISGSPPSDMDARYYYTCREKGSDSLQKQLKRLEVYKYKLGTENIQASKVSEMVQANEHEKQGIKRFRPLLVRSIMLPAEVNEQITHWPEIFGSETSDFSEASEDDHQQGIEHIQSLVRSNKLVSEMVQANEHEKQGIEHVQTLVRSNNYPSEEVKASEDDHQQGIEHIQSLVRSNKLVSEMVQANEHEKQGIEYVRTLVRSSNNPSEEVKASEDDYQQGIEHIRSLEKSNKLVSEMVQANEREKQGIEHVRTLVRSNNKLSEEVKASEDDYQQWIEHIRSSVRSNEHSETTETTETSDDESLQGDEDIEHRIRSPVLYKITDTRHTIIRQMLQFQDLSTQLRYADPEIMSTLFEELLELIEYGDLHGDENLILRVSVLKVIKLLHHYGVDTICTAVEEELKCMNHLHSDSEQDLARQYKKKALEVMLKICKNETSQSTMYEIICKAERVQVLYFS